MVQNVGSQNGNMYGSIERAGSTQDGRIIYQVKGADGKAAGGLSVAPNDCDRFERSYNQIREAAPKLEKYMQTHTQEDVKKAQKKGRWITAIGAFTGGIVPAVALHKPNFFIKLLCTVGGTVAGLFAGLKIAQKVTIPPGAEEMSKAAQEISKLDIKPI